MLKIAICDDTAAFLNKTLETIRQWPNRPDSMSLFPFSGADALIEAHRTEHFDLILLDIVMPMLSGIEAASEIRRDDRSVKIVFLTVSSEFAVDSYTVKADNYLLKPVDSRRLYDCLDEITQEIFQSAKSITVKSSSAVHRIKPQDIEFLEAQGKQVLFRLSGGQTVYGIEPLYTYEKNLLLEDGFFKCHRSYLVNIHKIKTFSSNEITMNSDYRLPISRGCQKEFEEVYFATLFGKAGER